MSEGADATTKLEGADATTKLEEQKPKFGM